MNKDNIHSIVIALMVIMALFGYVFTILYLFYA